MSLTLDNRKSDLFFVNEVGRIIFIPQGWCDCFNDDSGDDKACFYGWIGQPSVSNWRASPDHVWHTWDAQGWVVVDDLMRMRQVGVDEARLTDPDLFCLLDAINSGEAK